MDEEERAKRAADVITRTTVLTLPGMDAIEVRRALPYVEHATFDLYVADASKPAPTVFFVYGFPDPRFAEGLRKMGAYASWGRLLAASGMNAIAYAYREPVSDFAALVAHVRANAGELGVDASRLALWSASGNVPTALHALMTSPPDAFRAAALLYGYMLDVPAAAEQFGLGVPARGRTIDDLPTSVPLLVVRAGGDETPGIVGSIDAFVTAALARDLPLTLINQPSAPHAFDLFDDSEASRRTIRDVLRFLRDRLGA